MLFETPIGLLIDGRHRFDSACTPHDWRENDTMLILEKPGQAGVAAVYEPNMRSRKDAQESFKEFGFPIGEARIDFNSKNWLFTLPADANACRLLLTRIGQDACNIRRYYAGFRVRHQNGYDFGTIDDYLS